MIVRSLVLRHGRHAIARSSERIPIRQWRQSFSVRAAHLLEQQREIKPVDPPGFGLKIDEQTQDAITADWQLHQHQKQLSKGIGADVEPHYTHGDLLENPPRPDEITLELLLASQCHLGHHASLWHPGNARYIHGTWGEEREAIHIISLDATAAHLRRACKVVTGVAERGGLVLFVGTKEGFALPVVNAAKRARGCHLFERFKPGTFSNGEQMLRHCKQKVVNHLDEEMPGFDRQLQTRAAIKPDLVVCLNARENYVLLHECGLHNIPTIGIVDTNTNPTWVTYPIPANDDSIRSITLIAGVLGRAAEQGVATRLKRAELGYVDFVPTPNLELPTSAEVEAWHREKRSLNSPLQQMEDEMEQAFLPPNDLAEFNNSAESSDKAVGDDLSTTG